MFKTLAFITLSRILSHTNHVSGKFQSFHVRTAWQLTTHSEGLITGARLASSTEVTFSPVLHEPGLPEPPFLYRGFKQRAWALCYLPPSCFSLGSLAGPPGQRDYSGFRHHSPGIPANRAGSVVMKLQSWLFFTLTKLPRSLQSEPWARFMLVSWPDSTPHSWRHRIFKAPRTDTPKISVFQTTSQLPFSILNELFLIHVLSIQIRPKIP